MKHAATTSFDAHKELCCLLGCPLPVALSDCLNVRNGGAKATRLPPLAHCGHRNDLQFWRQHVETIPDRGTRIAAQSRYRVDHSGVNVQLVVDGPLAVMGIDDLAHDDLA